MMAPRESNAVLKIENGVAYVDVSTPKYKNKVALIDSDDLPVMLDGCGRWGVTEAARDGLYVRRKRIGTHKKEWLHRFLLGLTEKRALVDHRNRDTFDNRRCNLRRANHSQNGANARSHRDSISPYLGVSWHQNTRKWTAKIQVLGKQQYLGLYEDEVRAAVAYDRAAERCHGEFARLNFPL